MTSARTLGISCALAAAALATPGVVTAGAHTAAGPYAALARLPANCDTLAYIDVKSLSSAKLMGDNANVVRDRLRDSADQLPAGADWKTTLAELQKQGFSVKDIDELALCKTGNDTLFTLSGNFGDKPLVPSLVGAGEKPSNDTIYLTKKNGRDYATIPVQNRTLYGFEVAPGVLGISPKIEDLDAAAKRPATSHPSVAGVAFAQVKTSDGRTTTAKLEPAGNSFALTAMESKKGAFDPKADAARWRSERDEWVKKLRSTALSPVADDVARAPVVATRDEMRIRMLIPKQHLSDAIANAAKEPNRNWRTLREVPSAVGGGPEHFNPNP